MGRVKELLIEAQGCLDAASKAMASMADCATAAPSGYHAALLESQRLATVEVRGYHACERWCNTGNPETGCAIDGTPFGTDCARYASDRANFALLLDTQANKRCERTRLVPDSPRQSEIDAYRRTMLEVINRHQSPVRRLISSGAFSTHSKQHLARRCRRIRLALHVPYRYDPVDAFNTHDLWHDWLTLPSDSYLQVKPPC